MVFDPHSFSKPEEARLTHLSWKAKINFSEKTIQAIAHWKIENLSGAKRLIVDVKGIVLKKVLLEREIPTNFVLGNSDPIVGQALEISIFEDTDNVSIEYETAPGAEALQWLEPGQTAGKKSPFLFTQSQAILARTWIPCQDTPGVRFTYDAEVEVPVDLVALMSASNPHKKNRKGVYKFETQQPIPSYLMALAVGDVVFESVSDRSGIYAEPEVIKEAAWEFAGLEKMIATAEKLYGNYPWQRYDVLVLPPSFPFGGMENPRLTFVTPTIIAGDRSLTSLIAHELAHSWSGNLVTNATWNDFWLNEGFTVCFETRIMEELYGKDYSEMMASLNYQELLDEIETIEAGEHPEDTKLKLDLKGRNPDEGVTAIAYNKGYFFLRSLEEKFGRDKFDRFVREYFRQHSFESVDTEKFIPYLKEYYKSTWGVELEDSFIHAWIYGKGLPDDCSRPSSIHFEKVDEVISRWKNSQVVKASETKNWNTHQWLHFLKQLPVVMSIQRLEALDRLGDFTNSGNAEILAAWCVIAVRNNYEKAYSVIASFLMNTGRRKFLMPIYTELIKSEGGRSRAVTIFNKAKINYHFVALNSIERLLGLQ